jgi:hypothetical protein
LASPAGVEDGDYELIEAAVRETARGRWFLDEFARRVRSTEIAELVRAIDRLDGRAASRQGEDEQAREYLHRVVALLGPLIDELDARAETFSGQPDPSETGSGDEGALRTLRALDALGVADKLKLFR